MFDCPHEQCVAQYLAVFHVDDLYHKGVIVAIVTAAILMPIHVHTDVSTRNSLGFSIAVASAYAIMFVSYLRASCYIPRLKYQPASLLSPAALDSVQRARLFRRWCLLQAASSGCALFVWMMAAIFSASDYSSWQWTSVALSCSGAVLAMWVGLANGAQLPQVSGAVRVPLCGCVVVRMSACVL